MSLIPFGDKIVVLATEEPDSTTTPSGIFLPDSQRNRNMPQEGVVVSVGTGTTNANGFTPISVAVGDKVVFYRNAGTPIKDDDGVEYLVMAESNVIVKRA